jgi:hypothetical protein
VRGGEVGDSGESQGRRILVASNRKKKEILVKSVSVARGGHDHDRAPRQKVLPTFQIYSVELSSGLSNQALSKYLGGRLKKTHSACVSRN